MELFTQTPNNIRRIHVLLDVNDVDILELISLDVFDCDNLMADNISNRLLYLIVLSDDPLLIVYKRRNPIIHDQHHLHVDLHVPMSTLYTTQKLRKLHRK